MNKLIPTAFIVSVSVFSGCSTFKPSSVYGQVLSENRKDEKTWNLLTGKWLGEKQRKDGSVHKWLTQHNGDGTYMTVFFNDYKRTVEVGEWGVSQNIEFKIFKGWIEEGRFKQALPQDHWTRDAYEVISLTDQDYEYRSLETGNLYKAKKVEDDYEL